MGVISLGKANKIPISFGIPKGWKSSSNIIIKNHTKRIDVGSLNDSRHFLNYAIGTSAAEIGSNGMYEQGTKVGRLACLIKRKAKFPQLKSILLRLTTDKQEFVEEVVMFLITIIPYDKRQYQDNGKFNVFLIRSCDRLRYVRLLSLILRGKRVDDPYLIHFKATRLEIKSLDYVNINLDGNCLHHMPGVFALVPSHLPIFLDENITL